MNKEKLHEKKTEIFKQWKELNNEPLQLSYNCDRCGRKIHYDFTKDDAYPLLQMDAEEGYLYSSMRCDDTICDALQETIVFNIDDVEKGVTGLKMNKIMPIRTAIIIYNFMGMYIEEFGEERFEENYGSEGQYLTDEIGLTNEEIDAYTYHHKEDINNAE